jgi:hypothetical protein
MACILEPKLGSNGEALKWDPLEIPSTKPFVHIVTSASEPMSTFDNMNFVKTRSLIYSPFHKEARYVNFELGYAKDATWLEYLNNKWTDYVNFFVGGFLEGIYSLKEKGSTTVYTQINAKLADYDVRFRTSPSSSYSSIASPSTSKENVFIRKRTNPSSTPTSPMSSKSVTLASPNSSKSVIMRTDSLNSVTMQDADAEDDNIETASSKSIANRTYNVDDDNNANQVDIDDANLNNKSNQGKGRPKRQLSDLCNDTESDDDESSTNEPKHQKPQRGLQSVGREERGGSKRRGVGGGRGKGVSVGRGGRKKK